MTVVSERTKELLKNRYGYECALCGYDRVLDVHHLIPTEKGGLNIIDNLIFLCPNCHSLVHRDKLNDMEREKYSSYFDIYKEIIESYKKRDKLLQVSNIKMYCRELGIDL